MYKKVEQFFYFMSAGFLLLIMFALHPSNVKATSDFQDKVVGEVSIVWNDLMDGYRPWEEVAFIWNGVSTFFDESANQTIALLQPTEMPNEVRYAIDHVAFATAELFDFRAPIENAPVNVAVTTISHPSAREVVLSFEELYEEMMQLEEELMFDEQSAILETKPQVAGVETSFSEPVNSKERPWVTLTDNITGQEYCVSIYNSEVNKYLGECKYDYY
jgi:hypothetical protein